jgi:carbamoyl-phosphate synthase large subunit
MKNKRVFVSGGAGVIGLEMIPRLIALGAIVMVGDLKARPTVFPPSVIYRQGDLNSMTEVELTAFQPEVFIHLAATFERSDESYEFWEENFWHNVRLSHYLMTIFKDQKSLRRVIFASSYLIYDPTLYQFDESRDKAVALKETDPILPRNLTGMAKLAHEIELRFIDQFRSKQFTTACARIYRGYGRNSRDVISRWTRDLLKGEAITVYRPEGMFDYIYAADSAEGLIRLADKIEVTGILNLGTGSARCVYEVVEILRQHFPRVVINQKDSSIPFEASVADISLFKRLIGWVPTYNLEKAIPEIISYERDKLNAVGVSDTFNVLISSASKKIPLVRAMQNAVRKICTDARVVAGDFSADALSAYVADEFWVMPKTNDENIGKIIEGCQTRNIRVIFPTRDGELLFWALHAEQFRAAGIAVVVSPETAINICVDKLAFSDFGKRYELPFIPSAQSPISLGAAHYVVKERYGAGSREIGLNLNLDQALVHAEKLKAPIFQPYIEGVEISVDAWLDKKHRVKGLVLRKRNIIANGESQVTTTFSNTVIEMQLKKMLEVLNLTGPVVLQAIIDADGSLHVIECNARFGGASTIAIAAGLDIFYWSLLDALDSDTNDIPFMRSPVELRQVRMANDICYPIHDSNL